MEVAFTDILVDEEKNNNSSSQQHLVPYQAQSPGSDHLYLEIPVVDGSGFHDARSDSYMNVGATPSPSIVRASNESALLRWTSTLNHTYAKLKETVDTFIARREEFAQDLRFQDVEVITVEAQEVELDVQEDFWILISKSSTNSSELYSWADDELGALQLMMQQYLSLAVDFPVVKVAEGSHHGARDDLHAPMRQAHGLYLLHDDGAVSEAVPVGVHRLSHPDEEILQSVGRTLDQAQEDSESESPVLMMRQLGHAAKSPYTKLQAQRSKQESIQDRLLELYAVQESEMVNRNFRMDQGLPVDPPDRIFKRRFRRERLYLSSQLDSINKKINALAIKCMEQNIDISALMPDLDISALKLDTRVPRQQTDRQGSDWSSRVVMQPPLEYGSFGSDSDRPSPHTRLVVDSWMDNVQQLSTAPMRL